MSAFYTNRTSTVKLTSSNVDEVTHVGHVVGMCIVNWFYENFLQKVTAHGNYSLILREK